jgi:hypothetical protein
MIRYQIFAMLLGLIFIINGDQSLGHHWWMVAYLLAGIRWAVNAIQSGAHRKQDAAQLAAQFKDEADAR